MSKNASLKNAIALLISVCLSFYAWITIAGSDYAESALLGAIGAFVLGIQASRVWFGAFKFLDERASHERLAFGVLLVVVFLIRIMYLVVVIVVVNVGVHFYRGWRNTNGSAVPGYGLYEKQYSSPLMEEDMQKIMGPEFRSKRGWEFVNFYQWEVFCHFSLRPKQRAWSKERKRLLAERFGRPPEGPLIFTEADLPVERYRCAPMEMLYQPGEGWGLF
jgi:hypothetical protein